jgi:putative FmdB family regulatory protein
MPIYEYHCPGCRKEVSIFFLTVSEALEEKPVCPDCGSKKLGRVMSNVSSVTKSDDVKKTGVPNAAAGAEDTASLARAMRESGRKSKTGFGEQFKEVASRLEKGEPSKSIERSLRKRVGEPMETP